MDVLMTNGYTAADFNTLSNPEIAEVYIAATSGDNDAVMDVLAGLNLPSDEGTALAEPEGASADSDEVVMEYLRDEGYSAAQIANVSDAEMAEIYIALTSGDNTELMRAVDAAVSS
jgi:hypothetical protein